MARILFATYEFHPTTWGGCGVLLRHATDLLLSQGHEVVLLLDIPESYFERFVDRDHGTLAVPERCQAFHVDSLCEDLPWSREEIESPFVWKSLRFAHAVEKATLGASVDFVEFFEYCGVGYHALVAKRFGLLGADSVLGIRVHNSVELVDMHEGTKPVDRDRSILYGLERAAMAHAEAILFPSWSYAERYYLDRYELPREAVAISEPPTIRFGRRPERSPSERREIQFFGRIFEFKGVEKFVRAALMLLESRPDVDLDFVLIGNDSQDGPGGTSYTEYLEGTIPERFRERFVFTGHLDQASARERFGRALFAVFPNRFESFCYAAHEVYEAGVPLVVADIPAFQNYLEDEKTAFFFDGSSVGLAREMARLIDDPGLLDQLAPQGPLATNPLGDFYAHPKPLRPIPIAGAGALDLTIVVLVPGAATDPHLHVTLDAIESSLSSEDQVVFAFDDEDPRAAEEGTAIDWLGGTRRMQSKAGLPLPVSALRTRDALLMLVAGDEPSPDFIPLCRGALERNPSLGFAGTWSRSAEGSLFDNCFDVTPERYPFERGARITRSLIRTERDSLLAEAFEPQAGAYGEIGALWQAEEEWGRGCLLPRPLMRTSSVETVTRDAGQLAFLVQSIASPQRRERIASIALSDGASSEGRSRALPTRPIDGEQAHRIASEFLDGTTLARLSAKKLRRKFAMGLSASASTVWSFFRGRKS